MPQLCGPDRANPESPIMKFLKFLLLGALVAALSGCAATPALEAPPQEREQLATLALLCADVLDLYRLQQENEGKEPVPPKWSRFASKENPGTWEIVGYLTAVDEITLMGRVPVFRPKRVIYGVLAFEIAHPERYVLAIRGTRSAVEWLKDGQLALDGASWGDGVRVHHGFYSIYDSMRYQPKGGVMEEAPAWRSILAAAQGKRLTIAGHSLGASLGTYLALDVASERKDVAGRFFASPRPGNAEFAREVGRRLGDYVVINNIRDLVPAAPPSAFGTLYQSLERTSALEPYNDKLRIDDDLFCQHYAISYAAMLHPAIMSVGEWQDRLAQSKRPRKCIAANGEAG